ncbi:MAG TPA: carbohydrate ABC transporter permease, partial [bacterium]|nr:carbohydrate ABC transporter permease [bacterium]
NVNAAWGTDYEDFVQIQYPVTDPDAAPLAEDRREFQRKEFPLRFVRVPEEYAQAFRNYLQEILGTLKAVNLELLTHFDSWEQIPFETEYAGSRPYRKYWSQFVIERIPIEQREFSGFEIDYAKYLQDKYDDSESLSKAYAMSIPSIEGFRIPFDYLDYESFHQDRSGWRWFFMGYNYSVVLQFLSTRGRAVWNTFILVALTVMAGLVVNPITAYALSRFNLRGTQKILVFLLVPMSFPPEVSMIPSFLLLRSFPLGLLILGGGAGALAFVALRRLFPSWNKGYRGMLQMVLAFLIGRLCALPLCHVFHVPPSITLLNTYAALVLPGMASGFSIFLLKGFFDGLPRELYEAASMDGASEMQMFRVITYPLCKPIIVVTLMGQVLAAYGGFMWAFVVCQDKNMWTLMVWLYAFQSEYAVGQLNLIMAALTLASIPTFIFFIFCQKIIMRGIILPSMK